MLTPKDFYEIEREITRMYSKVEADLVRRICRYLYKYNGNIEPTDWKMLKLDGMGVLEKELKQLIAHDTQAMESELTDLIKRTVEKNSTTDAKLLDAIKDYTKTVGTDTHNLSVDITPSFMQEAKMKGILANARKGINLTNTRALEACQQIVTDSVNKAYVSVMEGSETLRDAVMKASRSLAKKGITVATYASGAQYSVSIESAVRRNVVTSVSQATAQMTIQSAQSAGVDLVRTSAHMGARPSHALWQGQVFSLSGRSDKYQSLTAGTGYGTAGGLCGCNCRHYFFPYVEGFNSASYGLDDVTADENEEAYEQQQKQRYYERQVRSWKRVKDVASDQRNAEEVSKASTHIKMYQKRLRELCGDTGLPRQYEREQI